MLTMLTREAIEKQANGLRPMRCLKTQTKQEENEGKMKYIILKMDFVGIVSRTVVVPGDWSLAFLHMVIQRTFGWLDCHQYDFSKLEKDGERKWTVNSEEFRDIGDYMESSQTSIIDVLGRKGDKINYTYDLGDCNEVEIVVVGVVKKPSFKDFATTGPDVVEDSAGMGGIEGIVKIAEKGKGKQYKMLEDWLRGALGKTPEQVLMYPSVTDIYGRVFQLVKIVSTANPKDLNDRWIDYLVD